jgi:hypothetical protein
MLVAHAPATAGSGGELHLDWNACGSGTRDLWYLCDRNDEVVLLSVGFVPPITTGDDVIGIEAVIDLQVASDTLVGWWRLSPSGDCRSGSLAASPDAGPVSPCVDAWGGLGAAAIQGYLAGEPRGGAQARIKLVAGVPSQSARRLSADTLYAAAVVRIGTDRTVGPLRCPGCDVPVCLVLNSIWLRRLPGAPGGDQFISNPGPGLANQVTWQGGVGADCGLVPVRRTSWGSIKSLFR